MAEGGTTDGLSVDDVAGSLAARKALGPDAEEAVIQAFLERTGQAIDKRVEERLAAQQPSPAQHPMMPMAQMPQMPPVPPPPARPRQDHTPFVLAIVSLVVGIPLTGIVTQYESAQLLATVIIWVAIAVINIVYNRSRR